MVWGNLWILACEFQKGLRISRKMRVCQGPQVPPYVIPADKDRLHDLLPQPRIHPFVVEYLYFVFLGPRYLFPYYMPRGHTSCWSSDLTDDKVLSGVAFIAIDLILDLSTLRENCHDPIATNPSRSKIFERRAAVLVLTCDSVNIVGCGDKGDYAELECPIQFRWPRRIKLRRLPADHAI